MLQRKFKYDDEAMKIYHGYYFKLLCIFLKFESSRKNYLEAFNFSILVDCSNKENSEKSYKGSNLSSVRKKEIF